MTNSDFTVVKNFVKGVRVEHDKLLDQKFVAQETGKDLSTNDFTDAYKDKLVSIQSGAQVNSIENIIFNNSQVSIDADKNAVISIEPGDKNLVENFSLVGGGNVSLDNKTAVFNLSDFALRRDVGSVMQIKGTVHDFNALPADASIGHVYNVSVGQN